MTEHAAEELGQEDPWRFAPLPAPVAVSEQQWPATTVPLVSILCVTYNHAKYIAGALDGFLDQATTFPVEILIHDDASTDGTGRIVEDYANRFPTVIKAICQTENQWSKGITPEQTLGKLVRGKYVAPCEGDDYWIATAKLQQQVAAMQAPGIVMCGAVCERLVLADGVEKCIGLIQPDQHAPRYRRQDFLHKYFLHTSTCVFRADLLEIPHEWVLKCPNGDEALYAFLSTHGDCAFVWDVVSRYRFTGGSWTSQDTYTRYRKACTTWDTITANLDLTREELATLQARQEREADFYWRRLADEGRIAHLVACLRDGVERRLVTRSRGLTMFARLLPTATRAALRARSTRRA